MVKRFLLCAIAIAAIITVCTGCADPENTVSDVFRGKAAFLEVKQDGINNVITTTHLTLTFDYDIPELSADNITVTDGIVPLGKGSLIKTHEKTGEYTLRINVLASATITVALEMEGCIFEPASKHVEVFRYTDPAATPVTFTALTQDGTAGSATTQNITLTFNADIEDLTADDISIFGLDGLSDLTIGTLEKIGTGQYMLPVGGIDVLYGRIVAAVGKDGYTITPWSRTVEVIFFTTDSGGTVSIGGGDDKGGFSVSSTLTVNTDNLLGSGSLINYQWFRGSNPISGATESSYIVLPSDRGQNISVRVIRKGINHVTSAPVTPISGWRVATIIDYLPPNTNNKLWIQHPGGLAIDSDDNLYIVCFVGELGRRIIQIDAKTIDTSNLSNLPDTVVWSDGSGHLNGDHRYIAVRPADNAVYVSDVWGVDWSYSDFFIGFMQPGDSTPFWGSGKNLEQLQNQGYTWFNNNALDSDFTIDAEGNLYAYAIYHERSIFKVAADGSTTSLLAGGPEIEGSRYAEGIGVHTRFNELGGMTIGHDGHLYVGDGYNHGRIRRINITTGQTSTFVGGNFSQQDGYRYNAGFTVTRGLTYGNDGNYYAVDEMGYTIRKITVNGNVYTIAGIDREHTGLIDGLSRTEARFSGASGIAADSQGRIYVVDIRQEFAAGANRNVAKIRMIYYDNN